MKNTTIVSVIHIVELGAVTTLTLGGLKGFHLELIRPNAQYSGQRKQIK